MDLATYQEAAARTLNPEQSERDGLINMALGLAGETGEVCEPIKKHLFHGKALDVGKLHGEIGDVLWYVAGLCTVLGISLDDVARENVAKLRARWPDGFKVAK